MTGMRGHRCTDLSLPLESANAGQHGYHEWCSITAPLPPICFSRLGLPPKEQCCLSWLQYPLLVFWSLNYPSGNGSKIIYVIRLQGSRKSGPAEWLHKHICRTSTGPGAHSRLITTQGRTVAEKQFIRLPSCLKGCSLEATVYILIQCLLTWHGQNLREKHSVALFDIQPYASIKLTLDTTQKTICMI